MTDETTATASVTFRFRFAAGRHPHDPATMLHMAVASMLDSIPRHWYELDDETGYALDGWALDAVTDGLDAPAGACPSDPDGLHHEGCGCEDVCGYCQDAGCDVCQPPSESTLKEDRRNAWAAAVNEAANDEAVLSAPEPVDACVEWCGHVIQHCDDGQWLWFYRAMSRRYVSLTDAVAAIARVVRGSVEYRASREQRERVGRTVTVWHPDGGPVDAHVVAGASVRDVWVRMAVLALLHPKAVVRHTTHDVDSGVPMRLRAWVVGGDRVAIAPDGGFHAARGRSLVEVTERGHGVWHVDTEAYTPA
jgi:hypothetical protein